jgi:hypothetical protein
VFPVRYGLDSYVLFRRNPVFKVLKSNTFEIIRISVVYVCNQVYVNTVWCLQTSFTKGVLERTNSLLPFDMI